MDMGKMWRVVGRVGTNKVGSECDFEFEVDEEDLPLDPEKRKEVIEDMAREAMWDSGKVDWNYEQVGEEDDSEEP